MPLQFPDQIPASRFLRDYWQRRPLLMRQALPAGCAPLDAATLAGLALETDVESRLVLHGPDDDWTVRHGPFTEADFRALPERDWTLLVQDVDKLVDGVADLRRQFEFLPSWRVDDVMISYAADRGSVGPHVDRYDVFLVQVEGVRCWQLGDPSSPVRTRRAGGLALLDAFTPVHNWRLEPGDILYLPPGVPHWGIAEGPGMTCSVGLRAPSWQELLIAWCEERCAALPRDALYADPPLSVSRHPAEITADDLAQWRALLSSLLVIDDDEMARAFGRLVTEPKPQLRPDEPRQALPAGGPLPPLRHHPGTRLAFSRRADGTMLLFANGDVLELPPDSRQCVELLCRDAPGEITMPARWVAQDSCRELLSTLVASGALERCDD